MKCWTYVTFSRVGKRDRILQVLQYLIAVLWVGSIWTVGYLVAPVLFATLADRVLAGTIAGAVFRFEAWWSIAAALIVLVISWAMTTLSANGYLKLFQVTVVAMLTCTLVGYFGIQPFMSAIRETAALAGGVMTPEQKQHFGLLHGVSSALFMVQSILGVWLLLQVRGNTPRP